MTTTQTTEAGNLSLAGLLADTETLERNQARLTDGHAAECLLCGRGLTQAAAVKAWMVHLHVDGLLVRSDAALADDDDQGWFPVGSECAKRVPPSHRTRFAQ